jgi:hypothetical protein
MISWLKTNDIIYIYHDNDDIYTCTCIHSQILCLIQDCWIQDCWIRHIAFTRRYLCQQISRMMMTKWTRTLGLLISTMTQILGIVATGFFSPLYPGAWWSFIHEWPWYFICCGWSAIATGRGGIWSFCTSSCGGERVYNNDIIHYIIYDICTYWPPSSQAGLIPPLNAEDRCAFTPS